MATSQFGPYASIVRAAGQIPAPATYARPKKHHHGGSLLGNLISDVVDTAKGIGPGFVHLAEHPVGTTKSMLSAWGHFYSPLVHGEFGKFWHNVHTHPLQPLIDLYTAGALAGELPSLGADTPITAELAGADLASHLAEGSDLSRLGRTGDVLRSLSTRKGRGELTSPDTRFTARGLPTDIPQHLEPLHYSTNLFRRYVFQKPWEAAIQKLGEVPGGKAMFGPGGVYDFTDLGRGVRALDKRGAGHASGARIAAFKQAKLAAKHTRLGFSEEEYAQAVIPGMRDGVLAHSLEQPAKTAEKMPGGTEWGYYPDARKVKSAKRAFMAARRGPKSFHPDDVKEWTDGVGGMFHGVSDPKKALVVDGKVYIVHRKVVEAAGKEADRTYRVAHAINNKPLTVWKWMVLANAPRYFVNNLIGQNLMLAASHNPIALTRSVAQSIADKRALKREVVEAKMGHTLAGEVKKMEGDWVDRWYLGRHTTPFAEVQNVGKAKPIGRLKRASGAGYQFVEKAAYNPTRRWGTIAAIREHPVFQRLYLANRRSGMSMYAAFRKAADTASENPSVRDFVEKRTNDWAGQYYHSNKLENMLRVIVPFYSWDRHALRFAKEQTLERPYTMAALSQIGHMGDRYDQQTLGPLPSFLRGAIPVSGHSGGILGAVLGGNVVGRKKVILSSSLNPLAAAASDAEALTGLVRSPKSQTTREALMEQVSPIISGSIEALTGQNPLTGARVKAHGGLLGTAALETFGSLPQTALVKALAGGSKTKTKQGEPTLYTHSVRQQLSSLLGLSERDFNPKSAARLYDEEQGIKKKKKRKRAAPQPYMPYGYAKYLKSPY